MEHKEINIFINANEDKVLQKMLQDYPDNVAVSRIKGIAGHEILQAIISLTTITLPLISSIIITQIKSKKNISVKYNGVEITGLSEENTLKILEKLLNEDIVQ